MFEEHFHWKFPYTEISATMSAPATPATGGLVFEEESLTDQVTPPATTSDAIVYEEEVLVVTSDSPDQPTTNRLSTSQHANWRTLAEKPLWVFFVRIRQIHLTYPHDDSVRQFYQAIKEELFARYSADTLKIARNYFFRRMPRFSLVEQPDLEIAALLSMWKYLDKFNPDVGTITFMQFFNAKGKSRLLGSVKDCLRSLQEFPRPIAKWRRALKPMVAILANKLHRKPTPEEILDEYGWDSHLKIQDAKGGYTYTDETLREILQDPLLTSGVFNQRQTPQGDGLSEEELESLVTLAAKPSSTFFRMFTGDIRTFILSQLDDENMRYIIEAYYWWGDTYERICLSLNASGHKCSQSWVKCMHDRAKEILKDKLGRSMFAMLALREQE